MLACLSFRWGMLWFSYLKEYRKSFNPFIVTLSTDETQHIFSEWLQKHSYVIYLPAFWACRMALIGCQPLPESTSSIWLLYKNLLHFLVTYHWKRCMKLFLFICACCTPRLRLWYHFSVICSSSCLFICLSIRHTVTILVLTFIPSSSEQVCQREIDIFLEEILFLVCFHMWLNMI